MVKVRLRTKLLLSLVFTTSALTCAALLIVQYRLRDRARQEIYESLRNSVVTFQNFQRQRQATLARSAGLLANLPHLKALMTTRHKPTIQDASLDFWRLAGSDLFVLADRSGEIAALHTATTGFDRATARTSLARALARGENRDWWFGGGHLYEVFIQPIYFGSPLDNSLLGILAMGYEIDDRVAGEVSQIASSQVAFRYGKSLVVSTLLPNQQVQLAGHRDEGVQAAALGPEDFHLGEERFLGASVELAPSVNPKVSLTVLKSYDQATVFLENLNRLLLGVGLVAVLAGSGLVFLISHAFTRPLSSLVAGVQALEKGDFSYPLGRHGNDEVAELTTAFDTMRNNLQKSQRDLLHAERLATIGRMASSISHDLRHPLTAILAYAEFLAESELDEQQRKELYQEIRLAIGRMTDLIASLLEFSKAQEALQPGYGNILETIQRAIRTVGVRPEFRHITITLFHDGPGEGWFDAKKLERVFHNLVMNACEAVQPDSGKIEVSSLRTKENLEIRIADNGTGIPESIRDNLFQPFVSSGKDNGTGLGLAVARKIVQDHGGAVSIESTGKIGTVVKLTLPLTIPPGRG
jgi:signal transduction histidine kinase